MAPKLNFWHGMGLVVGLQIGSGIFSSPNVVHKHAGSYLASLAVWALSGLLAWCGAQCYAELGSAIPKSGGTQQYLHRIYGEYMACMYSWSAILVMKPGSAGIIAVVLGEYVSSDLIVKKCVAIFCLVVSALLNFFDISANAGRYFMVFKFMLLAFVIAIALFVKIKTHLETFNFLKNTHNLSELISALYGGIWAYDGWDNLNFVAGEMENPVVDLPLVISTAMPLVICAYLLVNLAYFIGMTPEALDSAPSVALSLVKNTNSKILELLLKIFIALSCFGALNASMVSMVKITQVSGTNKHIPSIFSKIEYATILQLVCTSVYIGVGEFKSLITFYGATTYLFFTFTIVGMLWFRKQEPEIARPYRAWLVSPVLFLLLSFTLLVRTLIAHPFTMAFVCIMAFMGTPYYFFYYSKISNSNGEYELTDLPNS